MADHLFWRSACDGQDLHLAVGLSSGRLDQRVWAWIGAAAVRGDRLEHPYSLVLECPEPDGTEVWTGITVEADTGRVSVPGPLRWSFEERVQRIHLLFRLRHAVDGDVGAPLIVTVWIHEHLDRIWLTPRVLTLRAGHHALVRLSLLARFTNADVPFDADAASWSPAFTPEAGEQTFVHATDQDTPLITWSATPPVGIIEATGRLLAQVPGTSVVTAAIPSRPDLSAARATIQVLEPWAASPPSLTFLGGAGEVLAGEVANILFLPDGFLAGDETLFRTLTADLIHTLATEPVFEPLPLLANHVNHWLAWVPSRQRGSSVLTEGVVNDAGRLVSSAPSLPPTTAHADVSYEQYERGRTLLNLNDTTFQLIRGERRRAQPISVQRAVVVNPDLLDDEDIDDFLRVLTHSEAPGIGDRWATGGPDQTHIVIVGLSNGLFGANRVRGQTGRTAALTIGGGPGIPVQGAVDGLDIDFDAVPDVGASLERAALVVHELGHSWGLGDEYTESGSAPATAGWVNLHAVAEVTAGGRLQGELVRWGWPRLRAAAVLTAAPVRSAEPLAAGDTSWQPGRVLLTVGAFQAELLVVGDLVRVRTRPLWGSAVSTQHRVTALERWADVDVVELEPVAGTSDLLEPQGLVPFTAGSVLILPRLDDAPGPVTGELPVMHVAVREHLTATSNPLNAAPADPVNRPCDDTLLRGEMVPATSLPPGLRLPDGVPSWRIVGLFEGGGRSSCGAYRPAGSCLMKSRFQQIGSAPDVEGESQAVVTPFCPVCRYAIVDRLHPPLHPAVDALYDAIYPVFEGVP